MTATYPTGLFGNPLALDTIAESVGASKCILFLGAGVHSAPPVLSPYRYLYEERPPSSAELCSMLGAGCGHLHRLTKAEASNLQRVSMCYELTPGRGRQRMVEELRRSVSVGKAPSPVLRGLAQLPFPLIITTNYDRLFEAALSRGPKTPRVVVYSKKSDTTTQDYPDENPNEPFVFKLHGDIQNAESIVITDEDYIQFVLRMTDRDQYHPVPETFRYNFKRWPTLFVGYSLLDYNLRLLFRALRWKLDAATRAEMYSVDPFPDPLILDVWQNQQRQVTFISQDVWSFVPALYRRVMGAEMPI